MILCDTGIIVAAIRPDDNDLQQSVPGRATEMAALVLFCSDPLNPRIPDTTYAAEFAACQSVDIPSSLIDFEALIYENDARQAIRRVPQQDDATIGIFRGWMMRPEQYGALANALSSRNITMLNSIESYTYCHYLPRWYDDLSIDTPLSTWTNVGDTLDALSLSKKLLPFGSKPVIVKDWVKSRKHEWLEACYIPSASDSQGVERVMSRFLELQGDDLNIGLVFREFVDFERIGDHSRSGMPLTREFRLFYLNGTLIEVSQYWDEGNYDGDTPPLDDFNTLSRRADSNFFTMDVAKTQSGQWLVMELGDGQVAALPDHVDPETFYRALAQAL